MPPSAWAHDIDGISATVATNSPSSSDQNTRYVYRSAISILPLTQFLDCIQDLFDLIWLYLSAAVLNIDTRVTRPRLFVYAMRSSILPRSSKIMVANQAQG